MRPQPMYGVDFQRAEAMNKLLGAFGTDELAQASSFEQLITDTVVERDACLAVLKNQINHPDRTIRFIAKHTIEAVSAKLLQNLLR